MHAVNFPGMRNINRSIVLNMIREHGPISRSEIARRCELAPSAVSNIVSELLSLGLIREGRLAQSSGGRPPTLLELNASSAYVVGVNVGLTTTIALATDLKGQPVARAARVSDPVEGPDAVLKRVEWAIRSAVAQAGQELKSVVGVGVGVPGLVETASGRSLFSPNLHWTDVPVRDILQQRLGVPVYIDNDVRAATLGEREFGVGRGARHMVAVFVGSAIGAGLILDGELYYGAGEGAGEIGHIQVVDHGPLCSCGKRGCLEAVASGRAIARDAVQRLRRGERIAGLSDKPHDEISAKDVAEAAKKGDPVAREIMEKAAHHIGWAVSVLVNTYNPELVVIGGGVSQAGELLLGPIRETIERHAMPVARDRVRIVQGALGKDAGPVGAAALVMSKLFPAIHLAQSQLIAQGG